MGNAVVVNPVCGTSEFALTLLDDLIHDSRRKPLVSAYAREGVPNGLQDLWNLTIFVL